MILMNSNTNQMVTVACMLYEATKEKKYFNDALFVWNGDANYPESKRHFIGGTEGGKGNWEGRRSANNCHGKRLHTFLSWRKCTRMTRDTKFKEIAIRSAERIMNPATGWVDPADYFQLRMDGNGAFVHFVLDAYLIAPDSLADIPGKVGKMLEHVWSNHHGGAYVLLHRLSDNAIRNGWNPNGGEEGYGVDQIGTVHAQSQAVRAFGIYAYALKEVMKKR